MTSITETVRSTAQGMAKTESADKKTTETLDAVSQERDERHPSAEAGPSEVQLSDEVANTIETSEFDAAKVEALRLAIMDGNYPLDARRIAENMLNLERMIG
jgi:negative regulator of flagellin synthesis FlgM|tara:strand:+ start:342 stop:647 length:306 start_codon:yes stop_codon:yes gene_type:complete